jgi:hypothetical protein
MGNSVVVRSLHSATKKPLYGNERIVVGERVQGRIVGSILMMRDANVNRPIYRIEVLDESDRGIRCFSDDGTWIFE